MAVKTNLIAKIRKQRGMSQQDLAEAVGVHWVTISKLERGRQRLNFEWVERLAKALDVQESDFMPYSQSLGNILVDGEINEDGRLKRLKDEDSYTTSMWSSIFSDWNYWIEIKNDVLWPYFHVGDMLTITQDEDRAPESFFGRFCVFAIEGDEVGMFVGILSRGTDPGTYDLQIGNRPPMRGLRGSVLGYVSFAAFDPHRSATGKPVLKTGRRAGSSEEPML